MQYLRLEGAVLHPKCFKRKQTQYVGCHFGVLNLSSEVSLNKNLSGKQYDCGPVARRGGLYYNKGVFVLYNTPSRLWNICPQPKLVFIAFAIEDSWLVNKGIIFSQKLSGPELFQQILPER